MNALQLFDLQGRFAVITGASRGLGEMVAQTLAAAGASVALLGRDEERLEDVAKNINRDISVKGAVAIPVVADVKDEISIKRALEKVRQHSAQVDILVNNAGVVTSTSLLETREAEWSNVVDTNLNAAWRVSRLIVPMMIEASYGRIVNVTSLMADRVAANRGSYCASKAGLRHLTRAMAVEFGAYGITANAIGPSMIKTDLNREKIEVTEAEAYNRFMERVPLRRWGELPDLAGTVLFLASDASAYVTGQSIYVDGGLSVT